MHNYYRPKEKRETIQLTREEIEQREVQSQIEDCYLGREIDSFIKRLRAPRVIGEWTVYPDSGVAVRNSLEGKQTRGDGVLDYSVDVYVFPIKQGRRVAGKITQYPDGEIAHN